MFVVGGLIVGNPDDTRGSIEANLAFARQYVDWPYIQHPTPYPRTPMTRDFRERGLIVSEALEEYDGTTAVVRTEHVPAEDVEFLRWKAERWMKVRHIPAAFAHDPWFVMRHAPRMLAHTFRGSTWRTWLGLEPQRAVFERYRGIRRRGAAVCPAGRARGGRLNAAGTQARAAGVTSAGITTSAARGAEARRTRRHHHHRHGCRRRPPASAARRSPRCGDRRAPCR